MHELAVFAIAVGSMPIYWRRHVHSPCFFNYIWIILFCRSSLVCLVVKHTMFVDCFHSAVPRRMCVPSSSDDHPSLLGPLGRCRSFVRRTTSYWIQSWHSLVVVAPAGKIKYRRNRGSGTVTATTARGERRSFFSCLLCTCCRWRWLSMLVWGVLYHYHTIVESWLLSIPSNNRWECMYLDEQ